MYDSLFYILVALAAVCAVLLIVLLILFLKRTSAEGQTERTREVLRDLSSKADDVASKTDRIGGFIDYTNRSIAELNSQTEYRLNAIQKQLTEDIKYMSDMNAQNLASIKRTVDENLTQTLDDRLTKSYSAVNERLEAVYKNLGEVASLAASVSDVKKVFTNVKLRGTWGEKQLDALLSQMLSPDQYERSVKLSPSSSALVDFAVKIPSLDESETWLPIDSKFPTEEYQRLVDAPDKESEAKSLKALERAIKIQADSISQKYIVPPYTTDFAVMYLPTEGLYAEAQRMSGLNDYLLSKRVVACGPTNFGALLSILQTGFKTTLIEKRSNELWKLLSALKSEFSRFNEILDKTSRKLQEAQDSIESASRKTKTIERKLKDIDVIESGKGEES